MPDESNFPTLESALLSPELERAWRECLAGWEDGPSVQRADCRAQVEALRDQFLRTLRDITDPVEQTAAGSLFYVQVKSQWILLNTHIGYQIAAGRIDQSAFTQAELLAALLTAIERCLTPVEVEGATTYLSQINRNVIGTLLTDGADRENLPQREIGPDTFSGFPQPESRVIADTGEEPAGDITPTEGTNTFTDLSDEITALRTEWETLARETGKTDAHGLIQHIRHLEDNLAIERRMVQRLQTDHADIEREFGDTRPQEIIRKIRELSTRYANLQNELSRLHNAYSYLERELGVFDPQALVDTLRSLRDKVGLLEEQITRLKSDQEQMEEASGIPDADSLVVRFRELNDTVTTLSLRLGRYEADRTILKSELGFCEARDVVAALQEAQITPEPAPNIQPNIQPASEVVPTPSIVDDILLPLN